MRHVVDYHDLLSLGEVISRVAVQGKFTKWSEWYYILWHNLGRIEKVKAKPELIVFIHDLCLELFLNASETVDVYSVLKHLQSTQENIRFGYCRKDPGDEHLHSGLQ